MFYRGILFLILLISMTGCTSFKKTKPLSPLAMSVTNQEQPSRNEKEKVWIEAETKKVWVNNYVDENGDMIEGHYKHIIITPGHWAVKESGKE